MFYLLYINQHNYVLHITVTSFKICLGDQRVFNHVRCFGRCTCQTKLSNIYLNISEAIFFTKKDAYILL